MQNCVSSNVTQLKSEKTMTLRSSEMVLSVDSLPSYSLVSLETNDNSLIRRIDRLYGYKDTLFVFDRSMKRIITFNKETGKYLNVLSHVGNGPGEYIQVTDFCIDGNRKRIIMACDNPYKLLFYSFSGELLREVSLPGYYTEIAFGDDCLFGLVDKGKESYIDILDNEGNLMTKVDVPGRELSFDEPGVKHKFAKGYRLSVYADTVFLVCPYDNSIYAIKDGELCKVYGLDFKEHTLPEEMLTKQMKAQEFSRQCREHRWVCSIVELVQSAGKMFFHTNSGFFLCDKKSGDMVGYRMLSMPDFGGSSFIQALNGTGEIVEIISSSQLKKMKDTYLRLGRNIEDLNPALRKIYQSVDEESNPVLVICKI